MILKRWVYAGCAFAGLGAVGLAAIDVGAGHMATIALVRHGGALFLPVAPDSPNLSPSIRLALSGTVPPVVPGRFSWKKLGEGFEEGELPVLTEGREVDRIILTRVDPTENRIVVRNDSNGDRTVDEWIGKLGARLVINGSYYAPSGLPDTPFLDDGKPIGPAVYDAKQGALVVSATQVAIRDLSHQTWQTAFEGARDALVSYPLLLGPDGKARPVRPSNWLANRSFVGQDRQRRLIFGTTKDAFFSLSRLAAFLESAPLDLASTLNLDGGPVACQAVHVGTVVRSFCGNWELNFKDGQAKKLTWLYGRWALPVVIAVVPRRQG